MYFSINGHWETINNVHDISRIVREYYNSELANELDNLIETQEDEIKRLEELTEELDWAASNNDILMDEIDDLEHRIKYLERRIEEMEIHDGL